KIGDAKPAITVQYRRLASDEGAKPDRLVKDRATNAVVELQQRFRHGPDRQAKGNFHSIPRSQTSQSSVVALNLTRWEGMKHPDFGRSEAVENIRDAIAMIGVRM